MKVTGHKKLELVQLFCCKVARSSPIMSSGSLCEGDERKEKPVGMENGGHLNICSSCFVLIQVFLVGETSQMCLDGVT